MQLNENLDSSMTQNRRATDRLDALPTNQDILAAVKDLSNHLAQMERLLKEQSTAFPNNDLDKPDYDGHRKAHIKLEKTEQTISGLKIDATKTIIGIILVFIFGLMSAGFVTKLTSLQVTQTNSTGK